MYNGFGYDLILISSIHMPIQKLNPEILAAAIEGFEAQKRRIDEQIAELRQMQGAGRVEPAAKPESPKRKRRLSAAGRKAIAEASRKRWAAVRAAKEPQEAAPAQKAASKGAAAKKAVKKAPVKTAKKTVAKTAQKKTKAREAAAPAAQ